MTARHVSDTGWVLRSRASVRGASVRGASVRGASVRGTSAPTGPRLSPDACSSSDLEASVLFPL